MKYSSHYPTVLEKLPASLLAFPVFEPGCQRNYHRTNDLYESINSPTETYCMVHYTSSNSVTEYQNLVYYRMKIMNTLPCDASSGHFANLSGGHIRDQHVT